MYNVCCGVGSIAKNTLKDLAIMWDFKNAY